MNDIVQRKAEKFGEWQSFERLCFFPAFSVPQNAVFDVKLLESLSMKSFALCLDTAIPSIRNTKEKSSIKIFPR